MSTNLLHELAELVLERAGGATHVVAVDGGDAAGKTTFADRLGEVLSACAPVVRVQADDFEHLRAIRHRQGPLSPEGYVEDTYDLDAMETLLLRPLRNGEAIVRRAFDWVTDTPLHDTAAPVAPGTVVLIDGCFLLRARLRSFFDTTVFLDVNEQERLRRAIGRGHAHLGSPEAVVERFRRRYLPGFALYLAREDPVTHADVVIDNNDIAAPPFVAPAHVEDGAPER